jgi:uncharacterized protein YjiS (DUF1127 family)
MRPFGRSSLPAVSRRSAGAFLTGLFDILVRWQARARERNHLAGLSDDALKDIGLSRADVERESRKPFWNR